jgi:RNA polymerase sigma factor (sigma-70 family)
MGREVKYPLGDITLVEMRRRLLEDDDADEVFWKAWSGVLMAWAKGGAPEYKDDAEDIALDAFERACAKIRLGDEGGDTLKWDKPAVKFVLAFVPNLCKHLVDKEGSMRKKAKGGGREVKIHWDGGAVHMDVAIDRAQQWALIKESLPLLSGREREFVKMQFGEGLTNDEIAQRTGQPYGAVTTLRERAIKKLQELARKAGLYQDDPADQSDDDAGETEEGNS